MKISGIKIFEEVGQLPEEFILESECFCGQPAEISEAVRSNGVASKVLLFPMA